MTNNPSNAARVPRPTTELIEQQLEKYFPEHDIDSLRPTKQVDQATQPVFKWLRGDLIGKGTYGRLYLAMNTTTGELMAARQVEIPRAADPNARPADLDALMRESEILKDLYHPHIVEYLGFEETPSMLSLFVRYVPRGSISSYLQQGGRFADAVSRSFAAQILSALEYLHAQGIAHTDLKADSILVHPYQGVCTISDFGFAQRADEAGMIAPGPIASRAAGAYWVAPEAHSSNSQGLLTPKVDIWSLGCVAFEMWTGRRPWAEQEVTPNMMQQPPPLPEDVTLSASAEDFMMKCFAADPTDRPTAAELRKHAYLELPAGWTFQELY